ncbi:hypothetical protein MKX01_039001 [Papaver californicum]|nr:hypothetical protein MKX01_039001 [Papaver californicum]
MTESKLFTTISILMAFLFAYSGSLQLNNPDWYFWLPVYTFSSDGNLININYVYELGGFSSMDLSQRVVRENTESGLVVISMLLHLLSSSYQSTKGKKINVVPRYVNYSKKFVKMTILVILRYGIPLVFFVFLKGE